MAELIEEMQERLLPEYEQMEKFQICTHEQLRECIQKRASLQTKITQRQKSIRNYLDFIIFERKIHKWVCQKEKEIGKKLSGLKMAIAKRIINLYREGLQRFPNEDRLWQNFLQFSKKSAPHEVAGIYEKMLTFYGDKEKVWCEAGLWAYQFSGNMSKAKEIFYRALQRHSKSEIINKSFFDLLLSEAAKMNNERNLDNNSKSEQDIGLELVALVYSNSKKHIDNIHYYISLLKRCEEAEFVDITIKLQKRIIDDLIVAHPNNEILWDTLAQRELHGFSTNDIRCNEKSDELDSDEIKYSWLQRTEKQKIELCCKVYETAVQTLQTEKMYCLYINAMLKLNQDIESEVPLKRKRLASSLKMAQETCLINDDHLEAYVNMLLASATGTELAKNILEKLAPTRSTLKFYKLWLLPYEMEGNENKVNEIFEKSHETLGVKSLPIWQRVLNFYKTSENSKRLKEIFEKAIKQPNPEFGKFRAEYLAHVLATSSITEARKIYNDLLQLPPPCLEMQQKMLDFESKENPKDKKRLRLYHENIVQFFGKTNPEVWLQYITFERTNGDPKNSPMLYDRAKTILEAHLIDDFITAYTMNISHT